MCVERGSVWPDIPKHTPHVNLHIMISYKKNNKVVYAHKKKSDGTIFYIGIGSPNRPYNFETRSDFWKRTAQKHGVEVEILNTGLTWEQACEIEISLIKAFGRRDIGTGCLVNMTDGGDGAANRVFTSDDRKAMSEIKKGDKNPMYKHKYTAKEKVDIAVSISKKPVKLPSKNLVQAILALGKPSKGKKSATSASALARRFKMSNHVVEQILNGRSVYLEYYGLK